MTSCACGKLLPPYPGMGRPRVRCDVCAADKAALGKSWRAEHPAEVTAYNQGRRAAYVKHGRQGRRVVTSQ
jgi:hypothetical protein